MAKVARSLVLPPALGVYVSLFRPRDAIDPTQKPRYGLVLLFPKGTAKQLLAQSYRVNNKGQKEQVDFTREVLAVAEDKWGKDKGAGIVRAMRYQVLADGDERYPDDPAFKGMYFIRASSVADPARRPPLVVNGRREVVTDDEECYSGCTFRASIRLFPFDKKGNKGVGVGLNQVQVVRKGERLDGRRTPEEEFEEVEGGDDESSVL